MGGFYPIKVGPGAGGEETGVLATPWAGQDLPGKPRVRPFLTIVFQGLFGDRFLEGFDVFEFNFDMSNDIEKRAVAVLLLLVMICGAESRKPGQEDGGDG
jgi:hypothetical protein